jgi:hypothetical protein
MEKTSFIYIWFDRKNKMYYIGCHYGTEHDGYICSSKRMRDVYRKRPQDFKRRIIQRNIPREKLLEEEYKWLQMIPDRELGKQYYNHSKKHFGHWINSKNVDEIKQKCGSKNKGKKQNLSSEEKQERGRLISESKKRKKEERIALGLPVRQKEKTPRPPRGPQSEETKQKKSKKMKERFESGEWKPWSKGKNLGPRSEETKQKLSESLKDRKRNDKQKQNISNANIKAWAEGKFANRKSNNMRNYIWVRKKSDGIRTRIKKELFDDSLYILGKINKGNAK